MVLEPGPGDGSGKRLTRGDTIDEVLASQVETPLTTHHRDITNAIGRQRAERCDLGQDEERVKGRFGPGQCAQDMIPESSDFQGELVPALGEVALGQQQVGDEMAA